MEEALPALLLLALALTLVVGIPHFVYYAIRDGGCRAKCQQLEMEFWAIEEKECWCLDGKEPVMIWGN